MKEKTSFEENIPLEAQNEPEPLPKESEEVAKLRNQLLYARADLENMRKRLSKEREELTKYASIGLARLLCPVADNLQRALATIPAIMKKDSECKNFLQGLEMVNEQFHKALTEGSIQIIEPAPGDPFSYDHHQAVDEIQANDIPPGSVASVIQRGYRLHDRLIRPAMVLVASSHTEIESEKDQVEKLEENIDK